MIKIIPRYVISPRGQKLDSLAGRCAVKIYYDGNVTFSKAAAEVMNFEDLGYIQIGSNEDNSKLFVIPTKREGFKLRKRKGKFTWTTLHRCLAKYILDHFNLKPRKGHPTILLIKQDPEKAKGHLAFEVLAN